MAKYLTHTTIDSERWDQIAHKYYGDVAYVPLLIDTNFHLPMIEILPGGIDISIPIIDRPIADTSDLPPWRKS